MSLRQLIVMVFLLGSCQFEQCSDIRFDAILKVMDFSNIGSMRAKMFSVWPETVQKSLLPVTLKVTKWPQMPAIPRSLRWKNCPSATWLCQRRLYGCCLALDFHGYGSRILFNLPLKSCRAWDNAEERKAWKRESGNLVTYDIVCDSLSASVSSCWLRIIHGALVKKSKMQFLSPVTKFIVINNKLRRAQITFHCVETKSTSTNIGTYCWWMGFLFSPQTMFAIQARTAKCCQRGSWTSNVLWPTRAFASCWGGAAGYPILEV